MMRSSSSGKALVALLVLGAALGMTGCGDDGGSPAPQPTPTPQPSPTAFLIPLLPGASREVNFAEAVSQDGQVVVGFSYSASGEQAFRWTTSGTLQGLGFLPGYTKASQATAMNADGSVIVGKSLNESGEAKAFIWTAAAGMQPLDAFPEYVSVSEAHGVSGDGKTVVGTAVGIDPSYGDSKTWCFLWSAAEGPHLIGDFLTGGVEGTYCYATGISADGRVIVGDARYDISEAGRRMTQGFRFTRDSGLFALGWVDDAAPTSGATCASANGAVIGGSSDVKFGNGFIAGSPMRWTTTTGPVWLGRGLINEVRAVSSDGRALSGSGGDPGTAFVWDVDNGYRNLYGLLLETGLADGLEGTSPISASGMTADGSVVVGYSMSNGRVRAFYVRLP